MDQEYVKVKGEFFENISGPLKEAWDELQGMVFPGQDGYWIGRYCDFLAQESKRFFDAKKKLAEKYRDGNTPLSPQGVAIDKEKYQAFMDELSAMLEAEVEIGHVYRRSLDFKHPEWPWNSMTTGGWRLLFPLMNNTPEDIENAIKGRKDSGNAGDRK